MAFRYWVWSIIALVGAIIMLLLALWTDIAASKQIAVQSSPPQVLVSMPTFEGPKDHREDVDALLAIDFSGSMHFTSTAGSPPTDPADLRLAAAELMISSLASDIFPRITQMGYIAFGTTAEPKAQLQLVEDPNTRKAIISELHKASYSDYTNIVAVLKLAHNIFFPDDKKKGINTPALILLTDGDPRGGDSDNNEDGIRNWVKKLTDRGTVIFVVIVRNPDVKVEDSRLTYWRGYWNDLANQNHQLNYLEAQRADELEATYNKIRGRLVHEGTQPGLRSTYDANIGIVMPPDLLQAQLLISKPSTSTQIELIAPDGTTFTAAAAKDPRNELLPGLLYDRYRIALPTAGKWTLKTDTKQPIYYVLNNESLYSAKVALPQGEQYINADGATILPVVVVDIEGDLVSKRFNLGASLLRNIKQPDGSIIEQEQQLQAPTSDSVTSEPVIYQLQITPGEFGQERNVVIQISGQSEEGALVNLSLTRLPVVSTPKASLQLPGQVKCANERRILWPPEVKCTGWATATVNVMNADLLTLGTLKGELYSPTNPLSTTMHVLDATKLDAQVGPLESAGIYTVTTRVRGDLQEGGLAWAQLLTGRVEVTPPTSLQDEHKRNWLGFALLLVCALWKPLLVPLLLLLFRVLRLAPRGVYSPGNAQRPVVNKVGERHKLFTLTLGTGANSALDVRLSGQAGTQRERSTSRTRRGPLLRLGNRVRQWILRRPTARIVGVPFRGVYVETADRFERAGEEHPTTIQVGNGQVKVAQSRW